MSSTGPFGSSNVSRIGTAYSVKGNTGILGFTGPRGITGDALVGPVGPSVLGISVDNNFLVTKFTNGATLSTPTQIYGATGLAVYSATFQNIGNTSYYLGSSTSTTAYPSYVTSILLRSIAIQNNVPSSSLTITKNIGLIPSREGITSAHISTTIIFYNNSVGITLAVDGSSPINALSFNASNVITRIPYIKGNTNAAGAYESVNFISANIFERIRNRNAAGDTGSTAALDCIGDSTTGFTCTIDPSVAEYDANQVTPKMFGSKSHVYYLDFFSSGVASEVSIILKPVPVNNQVYAFSLLITGAKNRSTKANTFSSNIKWPINRMPCFSYGTTVCYQKMTFFGLGGTTLWYGTSEPISGCATGNQIYDADCLSPNNFTSGGDGYDAIGDFGACCSIDGSCKETYASECIGYFHGVGTTCGSQYDSICNKFGACCVSGKLHTCYDNLTCVQCMLLGISSSISTQFGGKYTTCEDVDCGVLEEDYFNLL